MNTQGWIRGMVAKNMEPEKFFYHVVECFGREFEVSSSANKTDGGYSIKLGEYECSVSLEKAASLQQKGAYTLDRYLLDQFRAKGFDFEVTRSQYIMYCYNIFPEIIQKKYNM